MSTSALHSCGDVGWKDRHHRHVRQLLGQIPVGKVTMGDDSAASTSSPGTCRKHGKACMGDDGDDGLSPNVFEGLRAHCGVFNRVGDRGVAEEVLQSPCVHAPLGQA